MDCTHNQKEIVPDNYKVLISEKAIHDRLEELGQQIKKDFAGTKPNLIGVLNGGFIFLADLIR